MQWLTPRKICRAESLPIQIRCQHMSSQKLQLESMWKEHAKSEVAIWLGNHEFHKLSFNFMEASFNRALEQERP